MYREKEKRRGSEWFSAKKTQLYTKESNKGGTEQPKNMICRKQIPKWQQ